MRSLRRGFVLLVSASLAACAPSGEVAQPSEVQVVLSEFAFTSSRSEFTAGKPYRFVIRNAGSIAHEWAVVPRGATDEANILTEVEEDDLPPGASAVAEYTFPRAGEYDFACYVPGHFEAGMKLPVSVVPLNTTSL